MRRQRPPANRFYFRRKALALVAILIGGYMLLLYLSHPNSNDSQPFEQPHRELYDTSSLQTLPHYVSLMTNVWDPFEVTDQPFFWYIPKAGGLTFQNLCAQCLDLVSASAKGIDTFKPEVLTEYRLNSDNGLYLNVRPDSVNGIDHAERLNLVASGKADIYISQLLAYSVTTLFDTAHKARMIVMLRHPTKRMIDLFYYQQRATWAPNYDINMAAMSLDDFAASDMMIDNFMVRSLLDLRITGEVTIRHVAVAKELLRTKFVVGISEWYDQSIVRLEKYLGWWEARDVMGNATVNACHYNIIQDGDQSGRHHVFWNNADKAYKMITIRNWADVELYVYAKRLFAEQEELVDSDESTKASAGNVTTTTFNEDETTPPSTSKPSFIFRVLIIICNLLRMFLGCGFYGCPC